MGFSYLNRDDDHGRFSIGKQIRNMTREYSGRMIVLANEQYKFHEPFIPTDQTLTNENSATSMLNRFLVLAVYEFVEQIQTDLNNLGHRPDAAAVAEVQASLESVDGLIDTLEVVNAVSTDTEDQAANNEIIEALEDVQEQAEQGHVLSDRVVISEALADVSDVIETESDIV